jgi:phosphoglycolate phosphatase
MKHKAILFDLDGTLLDTLRDIADSANAALASLGFPTHPKEAYKRLVGDGRETLARRALPEGSRDRETVDILVRLYGEEYAARWRRNSRPYAGVPEMLDALTTRGVKLAVLSNKPQDSTLGMTSELLPGWHFEVVTGASAATPHKPNPAAALKIAQTLGIPPAGCLFLGDTDVDMKTAVSAGMYPVGALWGFRDAEELLASGARKLLTSPPDLLHLL